VKHYAVLTDTIREEPFGFVIKDGNYNICYGLHSSANEWAELYNSGESKSLEEHLPSDVIVSQFGPLSESTKVFLDGAVDGTSQDIPMPSSMRRTDSQWLRNDSTGPQLKDRRLDQIHSAARQIAIEYKACAALADSKRSSVLLKTRLSNAGFNRGFTGFRSRGSDEGVYTDIAGGSSGMRRAAKELHQVKSDLLSHRKPFFDSVEVKVLGSRIGGRGGRAARRLARGAEMFDPDAVDADMDQLVQEGTPFERPKMPGKPNFIQGRRGVGSGRTGESGGPRDRGSDIPFHVSGPDAGKPRRQQGETDLEWAIRDPDGTFATQMRERAATSWGPTPRRGVRSQRNDPYAPENDPPPSVMRSDGSTEVDPEWLERHPEGVEGWTKANGIGGKRNERDDNLDVFDDILRDMDNAIRDSDANKLDEIGEELDALGKIYSDKYGTRSGINPDWDMRDPDDRDDWLESEVGMGGDAVGKLHTDNVNMEIVPATDVLHGEEGWTVVGEYRDIDGAMGNEIGYLYDNPNFETPEEAAAWVDSLDESIENEVSYDDWTPPSDRSGRSEVQAEAESRDGVRSGRIDSRGSPRTQAWEDRDHWSHLKDRDGNPNPLHPDNFVDTPEGFEERHQFIKDRTERRRRGEFDRIGDPNYADSYDEIRPLVGTWDGQILSEPDGEDWRWHFHSDEARRSGEGAGPWTKEKPTKGAWSEYERPPARRGMRSQQAEADGAERNDMSVPEYRKWREERAAGRQEEAEMDDGVAPGTYDPPTRKQIRERDREILRQGAEREGVSVREYRALREERQQALEEEDRLDDEFAEADREGRVTGGRVENGVRSARTVPGRREGREDHQQAEADGAERNDMSVPEYRKWREERAAGRQEEEEMDDGVAPGTYDPPTRKQIRERDREALRQGAEREGVSVREYRAIREERERDNLDLHWDDEDNSGLEEGQEGFARAGMRSFREFDRAARENAPYGTPEGDRARREDQEEYERLVQFLMDDSQERHDIMARLNPDQNPEDFHDYYTVLSREEAIKELQRIGNNARVLGTGPGSPLGELRKRTAEKHRSRFGAGGAGYGMRSSRRDNDSQILDASSELADAINSDDRDPDRLEHLGQKLRDGMQGSRDISAAPSKRDRTRQQYRDGLRQRTERDEMLDILNADPEERFSELRKLSEKEIVEMAKAAGIYDHRKSTAKMRRELAGLPEPVPGNIDDKFQFPEGRGGVRSAQRDPGMDINMDWDIRDPDDPRDWMESEMGPGHTAVGKISTANVNVEIVSEADIMGEGEGFMVSGFYRDIDGVRGNEAEWLYDLEVFDTPEEAAAWVDSLDESIENDVSYDDWDPPSPDSRDGLRSGRTQPSSRGGGKAGTSKKGRGPKPALNDQDYFKALKKLSPKQVRELAKEAGVDVTGMDHRQLMRNLSGSRPRPAIPGVGNSKIYVKPRSAPGQPVGGARSRMRTATTDRAATPQGLASRRRKLGYSFSRQPGSADGHIWDQLTPEQRELVAESAAERANWILRRNFGTGDPGKGGGYLTRFISDIQDGREVPARGEKKMGTTRPVGEVDVDTFRIETRRELEMFHRFINQDRGDTGNLFARQGNAQLKKQLQQSMDFITAEFNMRQGNQGAGYYEALEHFHDKDLVGAGSQVSVLQIMRRKAKERGIAEIPSNKKLLSPETYRAGPRVGADGLPVMEDGKQVVNTQPAHLSTIFGFAGGLSGESYAEEGGTTARTGRRKMRTDKEARRLADNDIFTMGARRKARRARADARRGEGQADPGTQGENPGGPTLEERIRRAKRKARIRFGKKKDVSAMNEHVKKARETIRLKRSATEKVVGAGAVEDFPEWDVTEGLPVLDEAMEVALDGIAGRHNSRRRNLKKGDEGFDPDAIVPTAKEARRTAEAAAKEQGLSAAEIKKAGDKAAAASDITNANITDHLQLVRDLYLNLGFNGSPLVVGDKEAQALLDDGWTVIQRGLTGPASDRADPAVQALARRNAIAYMDQAARHYSGGGGHGPLDDWARPYDPAIGDTDTRDGKTGSLAGNYGIGTMGFISPESKTVSHQKLIRVSDEHEAIVEALKHIRQETAEGGIKDVVDWLRKNPDASLIEELDRRQAARKIKAQVREKTRKLTGADAGTGTAKGKLDTAKGKEPMEADWKKTEMGALYHQIIKKIETAIAGGDDKTAERLGKSLKFLDDMAGEHEHMIAPILGYDVIGRHSGVTKVLNRGAIVVHETPMGMGGTRSSPTAPIFNEGDGVIQKVDELSPGHFEESIKEERAGRRFRGARAKKKKEKK